MAQRAVLVTGGGTGIGAAVATALASAGDRVAICGRRAEPLRAVAGRTGALSLVCDVADQAQAVEMVESAVAEFGRLDGLVLNAGTIAPGGVAELSVADWSAMVAVNLTGAFGDPGGRRGERGRCRHARIRPQGQAGRIWLISRVISSQVARRPATV